MCACMCRSFPAKNDKNSQCGVEYGELFSCVYVCMSVCVFCRILEKYGSCDLNFKRPLHTEKLVVSV